MNPNPDLNSCLYRNHHFKITWSDKTPLKANLMCLTCGGYVAFSETTKPNFGIWRKRTTKAVADFDDYEGVRGIESDPTTV